MLINNKLDIIVIKGYRLSHIISDDSFLTWSLEVT